MTAGKNAGKAASVFEQQYPESLMQSKYKIDRPMLAQPICGPWPSRHAMEGAAVTQHNIVLVLALLTFGGFLFGFGRIILLTKVKINTLAFWCSAFMGRTYLFC